MYERDNEGEKELRGMGGVKIASIITRCWLSESGALGYSLWYIKYI